MGTRFRWSARYAPTTGYYLTALQAAEPTRYLHLIASHRSNSSIKQEPATDDLQAEVSANAEKAAPS
jgi:hypothetical protein